MKDNGISEARCYPHYTVVKSRTGRTVILPELERLTDAAVLDFIEFCQEKGEVWYHGQFIGYRRLDL